MRNIMALGLAVALLGSPALAVTVGAKAPTFTASDENGQKHKLSEYKGKYVVLEWTNHGCPFVVSHYKKGKMQKVQEKWTQKGVQWLRVISSAPGKQGYCSAAESKETSKEKGVKATATFLDPEGSLGQSYGAKTTPHMFVIDPKGTLIYAGAIDNAPREDDAVKKNENGEAFVNYVDQALQESMVDKKKVSIPSTASYGCGVKYK